MLDELKQRLRVHEGVIPFLYLDTKGFVTCGIGHLIESALAAESIPLCHPDGSTATAAEKSAEWTAVKMMERGKLPQYYAARTKLRLSPDAITQIQNADIAGFQTGLRRSLPAFDSYPDPAREALLDMAFSMGVAGLSADFPRLMRAAKAKDWPMCAIQCHREGIQEWRNQATKELFERAGGAGAE